MDIVTLDHGCFGFGRNLNWNVSKSRQRDSPRMFSRNVQIYPTPLNSSVHSIQTQITCTVKPLEGDCDVLGFIFVRLSSYPCSSVEVYGVHGRRNVSEYISNMKKFQSRRALSGELRQKTAALMNSRQVCIKWLICNNSFALKAQHSQAIPEFSNILEAKWKPLAGRMWPSGWHPLMCMLPLCQIFHWYKAYQTRNKPETVLLGNEDTQC